MPQCAPFRSVGIKALLLVALGVVLAAFLRHSPGRLAATAKASPQNDATNEHRITVKFDYDFEKNPSCAAKPQLKNCIKQFDVYDVSGKKFKLFTIPVPKDATGMVKGITGQSPSRIFQPGVHFIAVTAEDATGVESSVSSAEVNIAVKPKPPATETHE
jgi:hypothetical protein